MSVPFLLVLNKMESSFTCSKNDILFFSECEIVVCRDEEEEEEEEEEEDESDGEADMLQRDTARLIQA